MAGDVRGALPEQPDQLRPVGHPAQGLPLYMEVVVVEGLFVLGRAVSGVPTRLLEQGGASGHECPGHCHVHPPVVLHGAGQRGDPVGRVLVPGGAQGCQYGGVVAGPLSAEGGVQTDPDRQD